MYAFALDKNNQRLDEPSVLATVAMWFELPEAAHAEEMITRLADADHETDWACASFHRIRNSTTPSGYHYGSVWPLFTGWASVGEYRYHRALPAYSNLRRERYAHAGWIAPVTTRKFCPAITTSPSPPVRRTRSGRRPWFVSPILRGLFGLHTDALDT